jgi:RHS repeat-associated protein
MSSVLLSDAPISDVSSMIIVQHESNMVAYLNDGMVYSNVDMAILQCNGLIDATADEDPDAAADSITIYYLEHTAGNPGGIPDSLVWPIRNNGTGLLYINGQHEFANKITVTNIRIDSSRFFDTYTYTDSFVVEPGQMLTFEINRTAEEMDNPAVKGNKISAFYDANALSFESMAFSEGVIKGTEGSWNYDYYLRDHLGSTRMVLSEDGEIQQALMYQPYGTVSNVDEMGATSTDPLRQKFTTKELDEEGVIPDDQRMALGIKIIMPDTGYTGSYTIKLNTVTEPYEGILYNRGNASDEPTLQCFMTSTMNSGEYYEYIELQVRNTTTSETYTYRLDSINWASETGYLKTYTLDRSLSEIDTAISTSANLFVESITTLGNRRMNLSYFGARYLDNDLGIWLSKDPSEVFFSPYAYTGNGTNPVNFIDPYGQEPVAIILGLAVVLYWLGHSLENYDAGMPPSYAFNPFKKYDGKLVWFSGTEDDLNQLSNSGAGINIYGENSGFYYDVAGQRNYPGEYSNNSAEANAAAIRNAYSKVVVPAPQVDPSWVISEGALLNSAPSYKKLEFGNLKLTVWEGWEDYFRNHLPNISENSSGYCLPYAMYRAFGDIRTHEEWIPMNENFDWCGGDKYKRNIDLEKNYVVIWRHLDPQGGILPGGHHAAYVEKFDNAYHTIDGVKFYQENYIYMEQRLSDIRYKNKRHAYTEPLFWEVP